MTERVNRHDKNRLRRITTPALLLTGTLALAGCTARETTPNESTAAQKSLTALVAEHEAILKSQDAHFNKIAEGKGNEIVAFPQEFSSQKGQGYELLYTGSDKQLVVQLVDDGKVTYRFEEFNGGGAGSISPEGLRANAVKVSGANRNSEWVMYLLSS